MKRSTVVVFLLVAAGAVLAAPAPSARSASVAPASRVAVNVYAARGAAGNSCARVYPLRRTVAAPAVLAGAMRSLLAGPTPRERRAGYGGWFSAATANRLRSATIRRGVAYVDFHDFSRLIPNASTSCGSALLLAQLDRTATQFKTVRRAVYSFDGSRRAFYEWLQLDVPRTTSGGSPTTTSGLPAPVTLDGVDGVVPGMTPAQAGERWGLRLVLTAPGAGSNCRTAAIRSGSLRGYALFLGGRLGAVFFDRGAFTPSGITIGSPERRLLAAYPGRLKVLPHKYVRGGHSYFLTRRRAPHWQLRFDTGARGRVTQIGFGNSSVRLVEGCA